MRRSPLLAALAVLMAGLDLWTAWQLWHGEPDELERAFRAAPAPESEPVEVDE
jgi:hypothetical protein